MFAALDSAKDTAFSRVIMAVHDMLLNKIISNDKDMHVSRNVKIDLHCL